MANYTLPTTRTATWTPGTTVGVPGGIPTNRTNLINVTQSPYNADNTGVIDATSAINSAISAAATNDIVYLPAGTYKISGGGLVVSPSKRDITLRGDGFGFAGGAITKLDVRGGTSITLGTDPSWGQSGGANTTISTTLTKGMTSFTVADATDIGIGRLMLIYQPNDTTIPVIKVFANTYVRFGVYKVTNVVGTTVTIDPPLPDAFGAGCIIQSTILSSQTAIGIESMLIDGSNSGGTLSTSVYWSGLNYGCWMKDVKMIGHANYGVFWLYALYPEMRRCWVDGGGSVGTNKSGVLMNTVTAALMEDNIVVGAAPLWEVNFGTIGSVIAYNYGDNDSGNFGFLTNHGPENSFNLYEGNCTPAIISDGYFGGSYSDTFWRNWITSINAGAVITAVRFKRLSYNMNMVGNIIESPRAWGNNSVELGYPNIGNSSFNGYINYSTGDTADMVSATVRTWTGVLTTRTSSTLGTYTINNNQGTGVAWHASGSFSSGIGLNGNGVYITNISGNLLSINVAGTSADPLPSAGTTGVFSPSPDGFQQIDLGVSGVMITRSNYYYYGSGTPIVESIGASGLDTSLFRTSKPSYFGTLPWPPYDLFTPGTIAAPTGTFIPAGYRYFNNADPSSGGTTYYLKRLGHHPRFVGLSL